MRGRLRLCYIFVLEIVEHFVNEMGFCVMFHRYALCCFPEVIMRNVCDVAKATPHLLSCSKTSLHHFIGNSFTIVLSRGIIFSYASVLFPDCCFFHRHIDLFILRLHRSNQINQPLGKYDLFLLIFFCQQAYEVPIAMKAVFDYVDTFSSRIREMEQQKRDGVVCKKEDKPRSLENFLSR